MPIRRDVHTLTAPRRRRPHPGRAACLAGRLHAVPPVPVPRSKPWSAAPCSRPRRSTPPLGAEMQWSLPHCAAHRQGRGGPRRRVRRPADPVLRRHPLPRRRDARHVVRRGRCGRRRRRVHDVPDAHLEPPIPLHRARPRRQGRRRRSGSDQLRQWRGQWCPPAGAVHRRRPDGWNLRPRRGNQSATLGLSAGTHRIRLQATGAGGGNIDSLTVR